MRARMALAYAGIDYEIREISLRDKPQSMLSISPKGTVPVFQLPNGQVIEQSLEIMQWAMEQNDLKAWWNGQADEARKDILQWIEVNDGEFKRLLDRYKYPERSPEVSQQETFEQAFELQLNPMEKALQKHAYLMGGQISLADIALFPFIRQFYGVDENRFDHAELKSLKKWLQGFLNSDLFQSVMQKLPVWKDQ
jgi:glutathione S-transferase